MKSISYDIDTEGDVELVLKNPNEQNIVPDVLGMLNPPEFPNPPCSGRYQVFSQLYPDSENEAADIEVEVRMRVSSRHLILASRVFRAMLEGPWKEGNSLSGPIRQISAEDWDAFALAIVLDTIHGRHHGVPTKIQLGLLARIATIVDYYQCREAMHFNYKEWARHETEIPWQYSAHVLRLYVSWVFHDEKRFSEAAESVLRRGEGISRINTHDLPVSGILTRLEVIRQSMIKKVLEALDLLQEEMAEEKGCEDRNDLDCTLINLGILIQEKRQLARLNPPLVAPFDGHSLHEILRIIQFFRYIETPHSADPHLKSDDDTSDDDGFHPCTIQGRFKPTRDEIDIALGSIGLASFQPKYTRRENF